MAAGFPTTVNPILQNGLVPVFVDVELGTYNTTAERVASAIGPRTRAIMIAHALGNPFEVGRDRAAADGPRPVARRGQLRRGRLDLPGPADRHLRRPDDRQLLPGPPHHHGRGRLRPDHEPGRWPGSWSRCATGAGTAGASRARTTSASSASTSSMGTLPPGYDHKYIFSHVGYNLKATDLQAALGLTQLAKLDDVRRGPAAQLAAAARRRCDGLAGAAAPAGHPGQRPELVRLRRHRATRSAASRRAELVRVPGGAARSAPGRSSAATSPATRPTTDVTAPGRRRADQQRHHHRADVLGRRLPRADRRDDRLRRGQHPRVCHPAPARRHPRLATTTGRFRSPGTALRCCPAQEASTAVRFSCCSSTPTARTRSGSQ